MPHFAKSLWRRTVIAVHKPEYLFNPTQLGRRLLHPALPLDPPLREFALPWGVRLEADLREVVGQALWRFGCFDLVVSETIWRLLDSGETAVDIGANVGYMSSVMAARCGGAGRVVAFEPHPMLFAQLKKNVALWAASPSSARVTALEMALGKEQGTATLWVPEPFEGKNGLSTLKGPTSDGTSRPLSVKVRRLDTLSEIGGAIGLMKIDVEGHEVDVLEGAAALLDSGRVRDIVFEEHGKPPTPTTEFLERHGFHVVRLIKGFLGPELAPALDYRKPTWEAPSYLATRDIDRARSRLRGRGWAVLRKGGR